MNLQAILGQPSPDTRWTAEVQPSRDAEPSPGWWHLVAPKKGTVRARDVLLFYIHDIAIDSHRFPWFINDLPSWNISNDYQWL